MTQLPRIAVLLLSSGFLAEVAIAQVPRPVQPSSPAPRRASANPAQPEGEARATSGRTSVSSPGARSVVRQRSNPYWYGQGRASRYPENFDREWADYRGGAPYQNSDAQVPVAQFDTGGGPNRSEQLQAQQLGIQRGNAVQQQISEFSRPYGFGFGFGFR